HGMLILSPNAVRRLETFTPKRALPKIFRMTKGGKLNEALFEGATINTPSLLCTEDYLQALNWCESLGGWKALKARSDESLKILAEWEASTDWVKFLCPDAGLRSNTGVTFAIADPRVANMSEGDQRAFVKQMMGKLDKLGVAYDAAGYNKAPPGLRIWCGGTVEPSDVAKLTPWLDWAFAETVAAL
ncbi:MAG: phosphoserine aminotransferase, partial [Hyphomonadaceae bacterium]